MDKESVLLFIESYFLGSTLIDVTLILILELIGLNSNLFLGTSLYSTLYMKQLMITGSCYFC